MQTQTTAIEATTLSDPLNSKQRATVSSGYEAYRTGQGIALGQIGWRPGIPITNNDRAWAICYFIKTQVPMVDNPSAVLAYAITERAIYDFVARTKPWMRTAAKNELIRDRKSAKRYLQSDMPFLSLCGVRPEWVRRLIREAGFEI